MSKVIIFSRFFPVYHPRKGESTCFVQKILKSVLPADTDSQVAGFNLDNYEAKYHTVIAGERLKVGDTFSPRVWIGKPYARKQIEIHKPIKIKRIFKISSDGLLWYIDNQPAISDTIRTVAKNDGLEYEDFLYWFKMQPFLGQIICWNENINY